MKRFISIWLLVMAALALFVCAAILLAIGPPWVFMTVVFLCVTGFIAFMIWNDFPQF